MNQDKYLEGLKQLFDKIISENGVPFFIVYGKIDPETDKVTTEYRILQTSAMNNVYYREKILSVIQDYIENNSQIEKEFKLDQSN